MLELLVVHHLISSYTIGCNLSILLGLLAYPIVYSSFAYHTISYTSYFRLLPREDSEAMLCRDGDFVLRVTELRESPQKATRELCLSVKWHRILHLLLRPKANSKKYAICNPAPGEVLKEFDSVLEMVSFYQRSAVPFGLNKVVLITPIFRQVCFACCLTTNMLFLLGMGITTW